MPTTTAVIAPNPDPGPVGLARGSAALDDVVPEAWRAAIPYALEAIPGDTSYAYSQDDPNRPGEHLHEIRLAEDHLSHSWDGISWIAAHEFGHLIAVEAAWGAADGNPNLGPTWWHTRDPEQWANCVASVWAGRGVGRQDFWHCPEDLHDDAAAILAAGPARHIRVGAQPVP